MTENPKNKLPSMPADIGFSLGFFCGAILAGAGVYLAATADGKKIKDTLVKEFATHKEDFFKTTLTEDQNEDMMKVGKTLQGYLQKIRTVITPQTKVLPKTTSAHPKKVKRYFKSTV